MNRKTERKERGVALILALLVVLATSVMAVSWLRWDEAPLQLTRHAQCRTP